MDGTSSPGATPKGPGLPPPEPQAAPGTPGRLTGAFRRVAAKKPPRERERPLKRLSHEAGGHLPIAHAGSSAPRIPGEPDCPNRLREVRRGLRGIGFALLSEANQPFGDRPLYLLRHNVELQTLVRLFPYF